MVVLGMDKFILSFLTILAIILLIFFYRKRKEDESNLGFKILGYYLLGAFSFTINGFTLPLGFLIFLLFVRPNQNVKTKQRVVYLGLAVFLLQLIIPTVEEYFYERPRQVSSSSDNLYNIDFTGDWNTIRHRMQIDSNARLENFHTEYQQNGQIKYLNYDLVSHGEDSFIYYNVVFSTETKAYTIRRHKVGDQWMQFDRSVLANRFFEVLDLVQVRQLLPKHSYQEMALNSDGDLISYAVEDRKKYLIQENQLKEITNDELPIKGFFITSCGTVKMNETTFGCESEVDYFFDVKAQ